jgi:hypothetical protein
MDIIGSISKQKAEIAKVILDIRTVQKENNKVSEALQRTEALADERVYQDAQAAGRDATGVRAYRALTDLRTHFEAVVRAISETGAAERECRDAAAKHAQLRARVSADNLDRLKGDLDQVRPIPRASRARDFRATGPIRKRRAPGAAPKREMRRRRTRLSSPGSLTRGPAPERSPPPQG